MPVDKKLLDATWKNQYVDIEKAFTSTKPLYDLYNRISGRDIPVLNSAETALLMASFRRGQRNRLELDNGQYYIVRGYRSAPLADWQVIARAYRTIQERAQAIQDMRDREGGFEYKTLEQYDAELLKLNQEKE